MSLEECTARSMRPSSERELDLLGEEALAADFRQRPVEDPVAGGRDDLDGERRFRQAVRRHQRARTSLAWARASWLPRVPIRITSLEVTLVSHRRSCRRGARTFLERSTGGRNSSRQEILGRRLTDGCAPPAGQWPSLADEGRSRETLEDRGAACGGGRSRCDRHLRTTIPHPTRPRLDAERIPRRQPRPRRRRFRRVVPGSLVLGIETSCDETAAALAVARGRRAASCRTSCCRRSTSTAAFGGVVPEIAARSHLEQLDGLVARGDDEAGLGCDDLDGVAATAGPGLIGGRHGRR